MNYYYFVNILITSYHVYLFFYYFSSFIHEKINILDDCEVENVKTIITCIFFFLKKKLGCFQKCFSQFNIRGKCLTSLIAVFLKGKPIIVSLRTFRNGILPDNPLKIIDIVKYFRGLQHETC